MRTQIKSAISRIAVAGYKSIRDKQSIEIRPLTILAGANSSGKSSIMQPLLLLKQTLEVTHDPGVLLLDGPNVRFTSVSQMLSKIDENQASSFSIQFDLASESSIDIHYAKHRSKRIDIKEINIQNGISQNTVQLRPNMSSNELKRSFPDVIPKSFAKNANYKIVQNRCFLTVEVSSELNLIRAVLFDPERFKTEILKVIHIPGLRGNPERTYLHTGVGETFPGTFENYTASVVSEWQNRRDVSQLQSLEFDLRRLGLSGRVETNRINDTQVELKVGRLTKSTQGAAQDLVNIADVGFGVSQTLPVLVALHVANPGQLVYLEQPEIHLHPKAQSAMASVLADAAMRGVRVVAETHSNLLLLGIQTLVAEGKLPPELVKLHWFERQEDGSTNIRSADLDESGAFGDWPEDFGEVELESENRYLTAAEQSQADK